MHCVSAEIMKHKYLLRGAVPRESGPSEPKRLLACRSHSSLGHSLRLLTTLLLLLLSSISYASILPLNAQDIARYQSQLTDARTRQSTVGSALSCLAARDAVLVTRRDASQIRLGEMRKREQELRADVAREAAARDGHRDALQQEERNLEVLHHELAELRAKRAAQEQAVRECKSKLWIVPFPACDLADSIVHLTGLFKELDERIHTTERRVDQARQEMNHAASQLEQVQGQLDQTTAAATALDAEIRDTEHEIGVTQAEDSALRGEAHAYQLLLDDFTDALEQAAQIDTDDGRMRTARQLLDAARHFDAGAARLAAAIARAVDVLPPASAACIRR